MSILMHNCILYNKIISKKWAIINSKRMKLLLFEDSEILFANSMSMGLHWLLTYYSAPTNNIGIE